MANKTIQRVSVPNLKLFGPMVTELWATEAENFLLCYVRKWAGGHSCRNINVWRFSKFLNSNNSFIYWYIDPKLAETFQSRVIRIV